MNICVYGSADVLDEACMNAAKALGRHIGSGGHSLVFGGFGDGLLGAVAEEAWKGGAKVISVLPEAPRKGHTEFPHSSQVFKDADKRARKKLQAENAGAFVVMPEGLGVLDELFEVLLLKQYGEHNKPIYIVNIEHKYNLLISLLMEQNCEALFTVISEEEIQSI
ncbi:MAG: LOG family protein [Coriobacteriia bacterium]|nr:LOG family protein [Coriobacteriia bacterium]